MGYAPPDEVFCIWLELVCWCWVNCKDATLSPQSRSNDPWNVSERLLDLERATRWQWTSEVPFWTAPRNDLRVFELRTPVFIAGFVLNADGEIQRDKRAAGPVEQSRGKTVMLRNCQKLPVVRSNSYETIS